MKDIFDKSSLSFLFLFLLLKQIKVRNRKKYYCMPGTTLLHILNDRQWEIKILFIDLWPNKKIFNFLFYVLLWLIYAEMKVELSPDSAV